MMSLRKDNLHDNFLVILSVISLVGSGDNRASMQSSFTHVTTNTWAHSQVFGFFRKFFRWKEMPTPPVSNTFWKYNGKSFFLLLILTKTLKEKSLEQYLYKKIWEKCFCNWFRSLGSAQTGKPALYFHAFSG